MAATEFPTTYANTTLARKYVYAINAITPTWKQTNFKLENIKRMAARYTPDGRQCIITLENSGNGSFRFMNIGEAPAESGSATYDEALVDFTTWTVSAEWDYHAKKAAATNEQAFIRIRMKSIADAVEAMGYRWSHALNMPKTNAVARIKSNIAGNKWQLYKDTESGANGTFGARYLFRKGYASLSATTTGLVAEIDFDGTTVGVDYVNDTVTFAGTGLANVAVDQYIYWGSKARTSKGRGLNGFPVMVDDGTNYATYEGIDRTAAGNEFWQAGLDTGFGTGNIQLEMINQAINRQRALPGTKTDVVFYGLKTQRLHFEQQSVNAQNMLPVSGMPGGPTYVGGWKALPVYYGTDVFMAMATVEDPDDRMYGLNWDGVGLAMLGDPEWLREDGEAEFRLIANTTSWVGHLIACGQLASKLPALHWQTNGITP